MNKILKEFLYIQRKIVDTESDPAEVCKIMSISLIMFLIILDQ